MKRTSFGMTLTLLLTSVLVSAFNVKPAQASYVWSETIYILANGRIKPDGAPIVKDGDVYTLEDDIVINATPTSYVVAIIIELDNITLDGNGHTLQGAGDLTGGIHLYNRNNVTIKNMKITAFRYGVLLYKSSNSSIIGNYITNNTFGIWLFGYCNDNSIFGNNINTYIVIPVVSTKRVTIIPYVDVAKPSNQHLLDVTYKVIMIKPVAGRFIEPDTALVVCDVKSGPCQDSPGSDNIGDTPYVIDVYNKDQYPLMYPNGTSPPPTYSLTITTTTKEQQTQLPEHTHILLEQSSA